MPPRPRPDDHALQALPERDQELLEACLGALRAHAGVGAHVRLHPADAGGAADLTLELRLDDQLATFEGEIKRALRAAEVGPLAHRARQLAERGERLLVLADRIPDPLGEALRAAEIGYIDRGGNAWLRAPGLNVLIVGRPRVGGPRLRRNLRGTDVRLLGVLLIDPGAGGRVQTELAERAGIALGGVGPARETLTRLGILEQVGDRRWRVRDRAEGLRRFGEGWAAVLRHKLHPRTYRLLDEVRQGGLEDRLARAAAELGCLLGGELAAAHLTERLRTEHATLHVPAGKRRPVAEALTLVPDEHGTITLLDRYGRGDEHQVEGVPLAHPLLVWAECLMVPDERVAAAVALLHEQLLQAPDA